MEVLPFEGRLAEGRRSPGREDHHSLGRVDLRIQGRAEARHSPEEDRLAGGLHSLDQVVPHTARAEVRRIRAEVLRSLVRAAHRTWPHHKRRLLGDGGSVLFGAP